MRQRNDTDLPLTVHTDPPQVVDPGQFIDNPVYVVGLTVLDDEAPPEPEPAVVDEPTPADQSPARPSGRGRRTDNAQDG